MPRQQSFALLSVCPHPAVPSLWGVRLEYAAADQLDGPAVLSGMWVGSGEREPVMLMPTVLQTSCKHAMMPCTVLSLLQSPAGVCFTALSPALSICIQVQRPLSSTAVAASAVSGSCHVACLQQSGRYIRGRPSWCLQQGKSMTVKASRGCHK